MDKWNTKMKHILNVYWCKCFNSLYLKFVFCFIDPAPPQHVTTDIQNRNVKVSWSQPATTFFATRFFMIEYTTDNWKTYHKMKVPVNKLQYNINLPSSLTVLRIKIYTCITTSIRSLPSNEVMVDNCGKFFF